MFGLRKISLENLMSKHKHAICACTYICDDIFFFLSLNFNNDICAYIYLAGDMIDQQYPNHIGHVIDEKSVMGVGHYLHNNVECTDWMQVSTPFLYGVETSNRATISESSSDGDLASRGL